MARQPGLATVLQATQDTDTTRYIHAQRGIHAQQDASDNWTWMLQDGLGSVRSVVDESLSVLESRLYEPYGTPFGTSGTSQTVYGFTGEPVDENELVYLRARYYAPNLGVFTGLDPFEGMMDQPMSLNGYGYVHGNPTNWIDPRGLYCQGNLNDIFGTLQCGVSNLGQLISDVATITQAAVNNLPNAWNQTWRQTWNCGLSSYAEAQARYLNAAATWYREVGNRQIATSFFPVTAAGFTVQDWLNGRTFQPTDLLNFVDTLPYVRVGFLLVRNAEPIYLLLPKANSSSVLNNIASEAQNLASTGGNLLPEVPLNAYGELGGSGITTIIGRFEDLLRFGTDRFVEGDIIDTWIKSGRLPGANDAPVTWAENVDWLVVRVNRGDLFGIATDPATLPPVVGGYGGFGNPNGYFTARELEWLRQQDIEPIPMYLSQ